MAHPPLDLSKLVADLAFSDGRLAVVFTWSRADGVVHLSGVISSSNGEAGTVTRIVNEQGDLREAILTGLWITDEGMRDHGFGKGFDAHSTVVFTNHGFDQMTLVAEDIGAYAWHDCRYVLAGNAQSQRNWSYEIWSGGGRERADAAVRAGQVTPTEFADLDRRFESVQDESAKPFQPHDIALVGKTSPWRVGNRNMWLGKIVLIGSTWTGIKRLP